MKQLLMQGLPHSSQVLPFGLGNRSLILSTGLPVQGLVAMA